MNITDIATIEGKYHGEFNNLDQIGTGSFGQVYKLERKSDKTIHAIKIIQILADNISHENYESIIEECQLLSKVNSDFVVELRDAWIEGQKVYIQTEFCDNNLRDIIDAKKQLFGDNTSRNPALSPELALIDYFISVEIFEELVKSLNYLHTLNTPIIHRDLKPENILLKDSVDDNTKQFLKICDFGHENYESIIKECQLLSKVNSDFVVELRDAWIEGQKVYIQTEFCDNNLRDIIDAKKQLFGDNTSEKPALSPELALIDYFISVEIFEELVKSLNYLHTLDFYTLKPMRFLVIMSPQSHTKDIGTITYMAPEVVQSKYYTPMSDIYSLGLICAELFDTIWALYVGEGYVMYYCPKSRELLRDKLETVSKDKDYCVNNLKEFSQSKQLSVQSADTILATALRVFNRNETFEPKVETKHNLRIHFVTKCRFGRQFCEQFE
ncbi:unnamed protein product [Oppiella nova]|uniref:Protein kinase domain-containing protein n=1 Tax=Oppiella nova TaxID=334625 RepID=A0A7R9M8P6_9ACAR|nr:unnamed protein product [Oppiella nova]CAG2172295.1 unnamed protein product [Oppiella nova]